MSLAASLFALVSLAAVATHLSAARTPAAPYVLILGTAQDGGLPQIGCEEPHCERARRHPSKGRMVSSLLICDPRSGKRWLIDASPDLPRQVELAEGHPSTRHPDGPRPPLFDGVFLTHAHVGHYAGLIHLGREAYGARNLPVFGTDRMRAFLEGNGPWSLLVDAGNIQLEVLRPDQAIELAPGLRITPFLVPHRDEFSDTVGFMIAGPSRTLMYLPDIDKWQQWSTSLEDALSRVDVALLDGTFFADGEVPGRAMSEIPHPFVSETLERLASASAAERAKVLFTHLNHGNPLADPRSRAASRVREAGMDVARDGQIIDL